MNEKNRIALLKACKIVGGQKQLAERIKVNPSRLNKWINRNKGILPYQLAFEIENVTQGQVQCRELLPQWEQLIQLYRKKKDDEQER